MAEAQPATPAKKPFADVLLNVGRPSLSATSDMPIIDLTKPNEGVDGGTETVNTDKTSPDAASSPSKPAASGEGEADTQPQDDKSQEGGEGKDELSPQVRAVISRNKNRAKAAEERAQALEAQLAAINDRLDKLTEENKPKEVAQPQRADFQSPEEHEAALVKWASDKAATEERAKVLSEQQRQTQEAKSKAVLDTFTERKAAFEADHPDFDDVVYADDVKIAPAMTQAILEAEDGPAIAYYLGQNPEVAERINGLSMAQQVYEIGKISAKLSAPAPRPKLAAPIKPLGTRQSAGPKDPADMSMAEYAAYRAEQNKARR